MHLPLTAVDTVPLYPEQLAEAFATRSEGTAPTTYHMMDPMGSAFRSRIPAICAQPRWEHLVPRRILNQGEAWFERVEPDLPSGARLAKLVHEEVLAGLVLLALTRAGMEMLYAVEGLTTNLMRPRVVVEHVYVSDGTEAITSVVMPFEVTEKSMSSSVFGEFAVMQLEANPRPLDARPLDPRDFELAPGSRISRAADRLIRHVVDEIVEEVEGWRPTWRADICGDGMS